METLKFVAAMAVIILGLIKVILGIGVVAMPPATKARIPFLKETKDATLAGHMYEYAMFIFGVYLITFGLQLIGVISFMTSRVSWWVLSGLGMFLIVFYGVVLYSNIPISKDPANRATYITRGFGSGIVFLLTPILWKGFQSLLPTFRDMSIGNQTLAVLGLLVLGIVTIDGLTLRIKNEDVTAKDVVVASIQSRLIS